jgi:LPXTG-motif cell wall-anchored protein
MPTPSSRSSRTKDRFVPAVIAFLCFSNGFLFVDSWRRHGEATWMFGVLFALCLLMLAVIFLLKKRKSGHTPG